MIKLHKYNTYFEEYYFNDIMRRISPNIIRNQATFSIVFPEAYTGAGIINMDFFRSLISSSITESVNNYPSIREYFNLCYLASLSYVKIYQSLGLNNIEKKNLRREYLHEYHTNFYDTYIAGMTPLDIDKIWRINYRFKNFTEAVKDEVRRINIIVNNVVDYDRHIDYPLKSKIAGATGLDVCPYCNRQYITRYEEDNIYKSTSEIDHFYRKSVFALFGLSLYNFIPSCEICNSTSFKGKLNLDIYSPYERGYEEDVKFSIKTKGRPLGARELLGWSSDISIQLEISPGLGTLDTRKFRLEKEMFKIEKTYQMHKTYVKEVLYKKSIMAGGIYTDMENEIRRILPGARINKRLINKFIYGQDIDRRDFFKKPLSKLTYDIVKNN